MRSSQIPRSLTLTFIGMGVFGLAACSGPDSHDLFSKSRATADNLITSGMGGVASSSGGASAIPSVGSGSSTNAVSGGNLGATGGSRNTGGAPGQGSGAFGPAIGGNAVTGGDSDATGGMAASAGGSGGGVSTGGSEPGVCVPKEEVCDGLDNNCIDGTTDEPCSQNCVGIAVEGRGYMFCRAMGNGVSSANAHALCTDARLSLVKLESDKENMLVAQTAAQLPNGGLNWSWMAANDSVNQDTWVWEGGEQFWQGTEPGQPIQGRFAAWLDGQPNGDGHCARVFVDTARWSDLDCSDGAPGVICEAN